RPLDEGDTLQHSLPSAFRVLLSAESGAHSMDALEGRQPPDITLFKSMTSRLFSGRHRLLCRPGFDAYILSPAKAL
ncbi:hypothetical protein, partial [Pseudomonas sp. CMR5c]|uniref:hypothetical protein n=1 Tax=Pseudomonas sp. CMR5c TaxID=658630 RepID=UPI001C456098